MKINYKNDRISVGEAAEMLGMSKNSVQILMQREKLPIGSALKVKNNYNYFIYKGRVEAYLKGLDLSIADMQVRKLIEFINKLIKEAEKPEIVQH